MFKVDNKHNRTRYETCLSLKLSNKYTRTTWFLPGRSVFAFDFEHLNDEQEC